MVTVDENFKQSPFSKNACVKCGASNGGAKRWKFFFSYNRSAYLCAPCVEQLGSTPEATAWLETNAIYDKTTGVLVGFKRTGGGQA